MTDRKRQDPAPKVKPGGKGAKRGTQEGAQQHAEGSHGPKARAAFLEQIQSGGGTEPQGDDRGQHEEKGKHRLFEQREQHDEADRNSEKNRLERDIDGHGHNRENFQVRGGSASSRAMPRNPINPTEPDAETPGESQPPPPQRVPGYGAS